MGDEENLQLQEFDEQGAGDVAAEASRVPTNAKELDAVYDVPVQVSALSWREYAVLEYVNLAVAIRLPITCCSSAV